MRSFFGSFVYSLTTLVLVACGGGGGGGSASTNSPVTAIVPPINIADTVNKLASTTQTWFPLRRSDGSAMYASLGIFNTENYPFVVNGVSNATASSKEIGLLINNADTTLAFKWRWKIHFDGASKPTGIGYSIISPEDCFAPTAVGALPTSSNSSGVLMAGFTGSDYTETMKAGQFAHYCNTTASSPAANVEWSVVEGAPYPYFCLTFPESVSLPRARVCFMTNGSGGFSNSAWATLIFSGAGGNIDYRTSP